MIMKDIVTKRNKNLAYLVQDFYFALKKIIFYKFIE